MNPARKIAAGTCLAFGLLLVSFSVPGSALAETVEASAESSAAPEAGQIAAAADEDETCIPIPGEVLPDICLPTEPTPTIPTPTIPTVIPTTATPTVPTVIPTKPTPSPTKTSGGGSTNPGSGQPGPASGNLPGKNTNNGSADDPALAGGGVVASATATAPVAASSLPNTGAPSSVPLIAGLALVVLGVALLARPKLARHRA